MMPWHGAISSAEAHCLACHAQSMELPTAMDPVPVLDEAITDPGH